MNNQELKEKLQELKKAKIDMNKISIDVGQELITNAILFFYENGILNESDQKMELALKGIDLLEIREKKLDILIKKIEKEISNVNFQSH